MREIHTLGWKASTPAANAVLEGHVLAIMPTTHCTYIDDGGARNSSSAIACMATADNTVRTIVSVACCTHHEQ